MGFGNLKAEGLSVLNSFLAEKSYIDGWVPSQADVVVFKGLAGQPGAELVNARRWYNQIASYSANEQSSWPGIPKPLDQYGPAQASAAGKPKPKDDDDDDDDDIDLFGSDSDEDAEAERLKEQRKAEYAAKKSKKPALVAKSNLILDVKPWDDETDMKEIEKAVRTIECDGLLWGASKLVPLAYGIKKLQISCVIVDDKVSTDFLEEEITKFEDLVQSMDIAAFNKV